MHVTKAYRNFAFGLCQQTCFALILTVIILMFGCIHKRNISSQDKAMLPQKGIEKYWLFNQITQDTSRQTQIHDCLLLIQSPGDQAKATSFYFSRWDSQDSSFRFGLGIFPDGHWSRPQRWPMNAAIPQDSATAGWRWFWNKRSIWLDGAFSSPTTEPFSIHGQYLGPNLNHEIHSNPSIVVRDGFLNHWKTTRSSETKSATAAITVFSEASDLFGEDSTKAIFWLNLHTDDCGSIGFLLRIDNQDHLTQIAKCASSSKACETAFDDLKFIVSARDIWKSPYSKKSYLLGFSMVTILLMTKWI